MAKSAVPWSGLHYATNVYVDPADYQDDLLHHHPPADLAFLVPVVILCVYLFIQAVCKLEILTTIRAIIRELTCFCLK